MFSQCHAISILSDYDVSEEVYCGTKKQLYMKSTGLDSRPAPPRDLSQMTSLSLAFPSVEMKALRCTVTEHPSSSFSLFLSSQAVCWPFCFQPT